jgi:hypothetical protein
MAFRHLVCALRASATGRVLQVLEASLSSQHEHFAQPARQTASQDASQALSDEDSKGVEC